MLLSSRPVTRGGKTALKFFSPPLEKCVGHRLKLLDIIQNIWAPLRKLFAPLSVPSWLRACSAVSSNAETKANASYLKIGGINKLFYAVMKILAQ